MALQQLHSRINASLHEQIKKIAAEKKISLNKVIETAIADYIRLEKRKRIARQLDHYISQTAEHSAEFTSELDHLTVKKILDETEW